MLCRIAALATAALLLVGLIAAATQPQIFAAATSILKRASIGQHGMTDSMSMADSMGNATTHERATQDISRGKTARKENVTAAPPKPKPNVLLLFPDQWRWDWDGRFKDRADLRMPTLRRLAEVGTVFDYAYTPSPLCTSARSALASLREYDEAPTTIGGMDFPPDVETWYEAMQKAGYHVIAVGKDDLTQTRAGMRADGSRHAAALGFDSHFRMHGKYSTFAGERPVDEFSSDMMDLECGRNESGGSTLLQCQRWCYGAEAVPSIGVGHCCRPIQGHESGLNCQGFDQVGDDQDLYMDDYVTHRAEELIKVVPEGKPWVLHLSFPGPHPPFIITEGMNESIRERHFPAARDNDIASSEEQLEVRRQYAAELENLDRLIGRLLEKTGALKPDANVVTVVMADHGEQLGEHHWFGKQRPWEGSVRVPMYVLGPGVPAGRIVAAPVSSLDAIGFIMDSANATRHPGMYTGSLAKFFRHPYAVDVEFESLAHSGLTNIHSHIDFRAVVRKLNATCILKVICCPTGCPGGNSFALSMAPDPQLMVFNVALDPDERHDLRHAPEAASLMWLLPGSYAKACRPVSWLIAQDAVVPEPASAVARPVWLLIFALAVSLVMAVSLTSRRRVRQSVRQHDFSSCPLVSNDVEDVIGDVHVPMTVVAMR